MPQPVTPPPNTALVPGEPRSDVVWREWLRQSFVRLTYPAQIVLASLLAGDSNRVIVSDALSAVTTTPALSFTTSSSTFSLSGLLSETNTVTDSSAGSKFNAVVDITFAPVTTAAGVCVAVTGKTTYTGSGGDSGGAHLIGVAGLVEMDAAGQTYGRSMGLRGRVDCTAGTMTEANGLLAGSASVESGAVITELNAVKADVTGNLGTISTYNGVSVRATDSALIRNYRGFSMQMAVGDVSTAIGLSVPDLTATSTNRAIYSQVASGANKYNLYVEGTAQNVIAGSLRIGSTVDPTVALDVTGQAIISTRLTSASVSTQMISTTALGVTSLTAGRVPVVGVGGLFRDFADLQFNPTTSTLIVDNATLTGNVSTAALAVTSLTAGRVPVVGTGGIFRDFADLAFDSTTSTLSVDNATLAGTVSTAALAVTSLTAGRVPVVGTGGLFSDSADLTFNSTTSTLSVDNAVLSGTISTAALGVTSLRHSSVVFVGAGGALAEDRTNFLWDDVANQLLLNAAGVVGSPSGLYAAQVTFGDNVSLQYGTFTPRMVLHGPSQQQSAWAIGRYGAVVGGSQLLLAKSRGAATGDHLAVTTNDTLGTIGFFGSDASTFISAASILAAVDGSVTTNIVPTRLVFSVSDSSGTLVEGARIDSNRRLQLPGDLTCSTSSFRLVNTSVSTLDFGGAVTSMRIGAATGAATIQNASTFAKTMNLTAYLRPGTDAGAGQTSTGLYAGSGAPNNANGQNGDYYFRADAGASTHLYYKTGGAWAAIV